MAQSDAVIAQGMATRHKRSIKAVVQGIGHINALLHRIMTRNQIKYAGYGKSFEWYIRKLDETAEWNSGQLGTRTFEEKDPIDQATLDYCFVDKTYGVSERSLKTNRAAGAEKIYDIQKENARVAQAGIYRAIVEGLYSNDSGTGGAGPAGLRTITGGTYDTTNNVTTAGSASYAGIALNASALTQFYPRTSANFPYTYKYWAPLALSTGEVGTSYEWSTYALRILNWCENYMSRTKDVSGTGKATKPDLALCNTDPFNALWARLIANQVTYAIPIHDKALRLAGFRSVSVGDIEVVYDENVPDDSNTTPLEIVFVMDSKAFVLETLNTKAEGLVEGEWKQKDPTIVGGVGVYKSNLGLRIDSPVSAAAITGCDA